VTAIDPYRQAVAYLDIGQPRLAVPLLASYLASHPDDSQALSYLAQAFSELGEASQARDASLQSLKINPTNNHALRLLAFAYADLGKIKDARIAAEEAQRVAPDYWLTHLTRARIDLTPGGGTKGSQAAVKKLLELAPDVAESHVVAADHILIAEGPVVYEEERAQARQHLERALAIDPQNAQAVASLSRLELGTRWRGAEGARVALRALAMDPTNPANRSLLYTTLTASIKWIPRAVVVLLIFDLLVGGILEDGKEPGSLSGFAAVAVVGAVLAVAFTVTVLARLVASVKPRTMTLVRAIPRVSAVLVIRLTVIVACIILLVAAPFIPFAIAVEVLSWAIVVLLVSGVIAWLEGVRLA